MAKDEETNDTKRPSRFQLWFEEAWEGWLKSASVIALIAAAYLVYKFDLIAESRAGLVSVVAVIGLAMSTALSPAWPRVQERSPFYKGLFILMMILWAAAVGYPSLRAVSPPAPFAEAELTPQKLSEQLKTPSTGPYELVVSGQLKAGAGEVEAGYSIKAEGGGGSDEVSGELQRKMVRVRVSRRGGTQSSVAEVNEQAHRLPHVRGNQVTLTADSIDEQQLEGGLRVELRQAGLEPAIPWALGALAILLGLFFDVKLHDPKLKDKTWIGVAIAVTFVFSIKFPEDATPHSLVRPAVGALVLGLLIGGLGGWLLTVIARGLFAPKLPKKAKR
jgi:hypothetical protein